MTLDYVKDDTHIISFIAIVLQYFFVNSSQNCSIRDRIYVGGRDSRSHTCDIIKILSSTIFESERETLCAPLVSRCLRVEGQQRGPLLFRSKNQSFTSERKREG